MATLRLALRVCKAMETTSAETKTIPKQYESKSLEKKLSKLEEY